LPHAPSGATGSRAACSIDDHSIGGEPSSSDGQWSVTPLWRCRCHAIPAITPEPARPQRRSSTLDALKETSLLMTRRSMERDMATAKLEVRARYREDWRGCRSLRSTPTESKIVLDLVKEALDAQICVMFSSNPDRRAGMVQAATGWRAESHGSISLNPTLTYILAATARESWVRMSGWTILSGS